MKNLLRFSVLSIIVFSLLAISGCEKDENGPDKNALLTAHVWKFSSLTTNSTDQEIILFVGLMSGFMANTTASFSSNGTYLITIPLLSQTSSGNWELGSGGTQLIFDKGTAGEDVQNIITLNSDLLECSGTITDDDYGTINVIYKWVK